MPRVSIVVPVYNGEAHLSECLASIAAQTYSSWEAVVVNNCSKDKTGEIADLFARQDSRFRVVHCREFLSQPENYNRAVNCGASAAEYVKIVEADNQLWPECVERMVALAESDPKIGLVGCYWFHGEGFRGDGLPPSSGILDGNEIRREHLLTDVYYLGTPTTLLFRAAALLSLTPCFRPGLFFDDVDLCFRVLRDWKFGFLHQVLAFVRDDNNGLFNAFAEFDYIPAYRYLLAATYSREMFDSGQAEAIIERRKAAYYRQLGYWLVHGRPKQYWEFHQKAGRLMGHELSYAELIRWATVEIWDLIYNHKATLKIRQPMRQLKHRCGKCVRAVLGSCRRHKKADSVISTSR